MRRFHAPLIFTSRNAAMKCVQSNRTHHDNYFVKRVSNGDSRAQLHRDLGNWSVRHRWIAASHAGDTGHVSGGGRTSCGSLSAPCGGIALAWSLGQSGKGV